MFCQTNYNQVTSCSTRKGGHFLPNSSPNSETEQERLKKEIVTYFHLCIIKWRRQHLINPRPTEIFPSDVEKLVEEIKEFVEIIKDVDYIDNEEITEHFEWTSKGKIECFKYFYEK